MVYWSISKDDARHCERFATDAAGVIAMRPSHGRSSDPLKLAFASTRTCCLHRFDGLEYSQYGITCLLQVVKCGHTDLQVNPISRIVLYRGRGDDQTTSAAVGRNISYIYLAQLAGRSFILPRLSCLLYDARRLLSAKLKQRKLRWLEFLYPRQKLPRDTPSQLCACE